MSKVYFGISPIIPHLQLELVKADEGLRQIERRECSLEEALLVLSQTDQALVGLTLPRRPSLGLVKLPAAKNGGRGRAASHEVHKRVCETILQKAGVKTLTTPTEDQTCPPWMRQGFDLYGRLEADGFRAFAEEDQEKTYFETHVEGLFRSLLGQSLLPAKSLEGRIQRQLILLERGMRIADPMDFFEEVTRHRLIQGNLPLQKLYAPFELEAMGAAYMAWYVHNQPQQISRIGDSREGEFLLPYAKEWETEHKTTEVQQMAIF